MLQKLELQRIELNQPEIVRELELPVGTISEPTEQKFDRLESMARGLYAVVMGFRLLFKYGRLAVKEARLRKNLEPQRGQDEFLRHLPKHLSREIYETCLKQILSVRTQIHGRIPEFKPSERGIFISKHPTSNALFGELCFITEHLQPKIAIVSKIENLNELPMSYLIGKAGYESGNAIFVDRNDREKALASIQAACETIFHPGSGVWIATDGTRPKPNKKPKIHWRGIHRLLKATEDVPRKVISLNTGFNRDDYGLRDAVRLPGATLNIAVQDVTYEIPSDEKELEEWVLEDWKRKDNQSGQWQDASDTIKRT